MNKIQLYSAHSCPYAHRTRLVLQEKELDYELIEIDLQNMPDWYLKISPNGKIPLLKRGDYIVWESATINEYLDELYPTPALLPGSPEQRARIRNWINFADQEFLVHLHKLLFENDQKKYDEIYTKLDTSLEYLNREGLSNATPYWTGEDVSLVDYTYYPFFERFALLEYYRDFSISPEYKKLQNWLENMRKLPAVQATMNSPDFYIKEFAKWFS